MVVHMGVARIMLIHIVEANHMVTTFNFHKLVIHIIVLVANKHHLKDVHMENSDLKFIKEEDNSHLNSLQMLLEDNQEVIINYVSKFKSLLVSRL